MSPLLPYLPAGFVAERLTLTLGQLVYYTADSTIWPHPECDQRDRPTLLFLHSQGGGSSAYEWSKVYPAFAAEARIIAPDLVGWGASDHPTQDYQVSDYLTMMLELIEETNAKPVVAIASSLTAGLVIRLAVDHPEYFQSLFLVCPSGYSDFGEDYQSNIAAQLAGTPFIDRLIYTVGAANELAVRNFLQQFLFAQASRISDEIVAAYLTSATQPNAEYSALASLKGNLCFDLSRYIPQLTVPTTLIWGEAAQFSRKSKGQRLAQLNPEVIKALHTVLDTGVLPHLEQPAVVTAYLSRHLQETHNV